MTPVLSTVDAVLIIAVVALCSFAVRALPFLFFGGKRKVPAVVTYLGAYLPPAIMVVLVLYCIKNISFAAPAGFLPELIAIAVTALLHLWKKNSLLSISAGVLVYMILVQTVWIK